MTDAERQKRTEEELFLLFSLLTRDTRHQLEQIASGYYAGSVSAWQLSDRLVQALNSSHAHATYLGRRLAGKRQPFGTADQQFAASIVIGQGQYLRGLVSDILTGRYTPKEDGTINAALAARLALYAARLRGTALESWLLNLPQATMVRWVLHPAEHCEDCISRAEGSPYDAHTIPWTPSDGSSACGVNCKCTLETVDGQAGFSAVSD